MSRVEIRFNIKRSLQAQKVISDISKYQIELILKIKEKNLILVTDEGKDFTCWLEDEQRNFISSVDKRTVHILYENNWVNEVPWDRSKFGKNEFVYCLSEKALRIIKEINEIECIDYTINNI